MTNLFYIGQRKAASLPKESVWIKDPYDVVKIDEDNTSYRWHEGVKGRDIKRPSRAMPAGGYVALSSSNPHEITYNFCNETGTAEITASNHPKNIYYYNTEYDFIVAVRTVHIPDNLKEILDHTEYLLKMGPTPAPGISVSKGTCTIAHYLTLEYR